MTFERGWIFVSANYGIVPIMLVSFLTASRTLGFVKMARKIEAKQEAKKVAYASTDKKDQAAPSSDSKKSQ